MRYHLSMARRKFDPGSAKGDLFSDGDSVSGKNQGRRPVADQLTVSQVSELIKSTLEQRIPSPLRVVGEVSNFSVRNHWYFSLKDEKSILSCAVWASSARKIGFTPSDGDEVVATGHISHYGPQGRTQFYVSKLEPVGAGALELAFRKMCEQLREKGYFDEAHKIPLPSFPRRIAVITSAKGAAVQDVIVTAAQRCRAVGLLIVDVRVQGEGAAEEVAKAIRRIDRHHKRLKVDAILVTRGGGSLEDLRAFNERVVADAVYRCELPLVAAIGHESDTSVIELVADLRAATPTQAAMRLVPSSSELHTQLDHHEHRIGSLIHRLVERCRERLKAIERHEAFRTPRAIIEQAREKLNRLDLDVRRMLRSRLSHERSRLEQLAGHWNRLHPMAIVSERHERLAVLHERLDRVTRHHVLRARQRVESLDRELKAVDPRNVLGRGYSYTTDSRKKLIRKVGDVEAGCLLITHVSDGTIDSIVGNSRLRPRRSRKRNNDRTSQMDLFGPSE